MENGPVRSVKGTGTMKKTAHTTTISVLYIFAAVIVLFCLSPMLWPNSDALSRSKPLQLKTLATYPHDKNAFTQGLTFENGFLYESIGGYGASSLRKVEPNTGKVLRQVTVPRQYFAEGIERIGDSIFQLTWREGYCFVYDKETFELKGHFRYNGEGWGLTFDGEHFVLSDGSSWLRFLDTKNFKQKRKIQVTDRNAKTKKSVPIKNLNELEFVRGEIWANIWQSTNIVRIDPRSGEVIGWIDCSVFVPDEFKKELTGSTMMQDNVLNGIAFDPATNRVYLTGKKWPVLYEVQIVEP